MAKPEPAAVAVIVRCERCGLTQTADHPCGLCGSTNMTALKTKEVTREVSGRG